MSSPGSARIPTSVACLGYGGLLPFVGLAAAGGVLRARGDAAVDQAAVTQGILAYGAVILSFVGALHWGFAIGIPGLDRTVRDRSFIWSVMPALLAWLCLLLPPFAACLGLIAGFALHYGCDRRLPYLAQLPAWYLPLRLRLTAVACVCLGLSALWLGVR